MEIKDSAAFSIVAGTFQVAMVIVEDLKFKGLRGKSQSARSDDFGRLPLSLSVPLLHI